MNKKISSLILGVIFILLCWHISSIMVNNSIVIPKINSVFTALIQLLISKSTYGIVVKTFLRLILIITISFIIAIILVSISIYSKEIRFFLRPTISFIKSTPVVALIIILLVIIGNNRTPLVVTSFVLIPIFYETIFMGIQSIDKNILDDIETLTNFSFEILFKMYIPLIFNEIITSFMQTFGLGLKSLVMSEFIAQPKNSIGYEILKNKNTLNMEYVFAWTIILVFLVLIVEVSINKIYEKNINIK